MDGVTGDIYDIDITASGDLFAVAGNGKIFKRTVNRWEKECNW